MSDPSARAAAEQRDELAAAAHSITSSRGRAVFRVLPAEPLFGQALKTKRVPV
jgi:hypothetical protein